MKFVASTLSASLFLLASATSVQAENPRVTALLSESATAALNADWQRGASLSRRLLSTPDLSSEIAAAGWSHLCVHLTNLADFGNAMVACNKSVALEPASWGNYMNRANLYVARNEMPQARSDYNRAKALNPSASVLEQAYASPGSYIMLAPGDVGSQLADAK